MYGVVLWRCERSKSAVIWCEDHGDLAFLNLESDLIENGATVEPGDLMQFQPHNGAEMREARRAVRISQEYAPDLVEMLEERKAAPQPSAATPAPASSVKEPHSAQVIPFPTAVQRCDPRRDRAVS